MGQTVAGITDDILEDSKIEVVPITHELFLSSLALYSMVDCISMIVMKNLTLIEVLTLDKHFTQEGFRILL